MIHSIPASYRNSANTSLEYRFEKLSDDTKKMLADCPGLQEFLPRAIKFLTDPKSNNTRHAETVAHYLMGKVDYLPENRVDELEPPQPAIPREVREALSDLLRTHQRGFSAEDPSKTIQKLTALYNHVGNDGYDARLSAWMEAAPAGERSNRLNAVVKIQDELKENSKSWDLRGLDLTTLPPLPPDLWRLDLSKNSFASLEGLLDLPLLTHLYLHDNGEATPLKNLMAELGEQRKRRIVADQQQ